MEKAKKKRVGDAEAPRLSNGDFKTISNVLSVTIAVCYLTDRTSRLKEVINLYGLKNGCFTVRQFLI